MFSHAYVKSFFASSLSLSLSSVRNYINLLYLFLLRFIEKIKLLDYRIKLKGIQNTVKMKFD